MNDDLDYSRRHGAKTIISTKSSALQNGHEDAIYTSHNVHPPQHLEMSYHESIDEDNDLDTPLSAMQSAAIKTALIVNKRPIIHDLVSIEEDVEEECFSRHWIFRRRVGFETVHSPPGEVKPADIDQQHAVTLDTTVLDIAHTAKLKDERDQLKKELESIQLKRRQLQYTHDRMTSFTREWVYQLCAAQQSYNLASSQLQSTHSKIDYIHSEYSLAQRWHVLGDVFFIWHDGPFATINGTRLGRSAKTAFSSTKSNDSKSSSIFSWGETVNAPHNIPTSITVSFLEINSAIGQVVFLLYTLQNTPNSGISFQKHILQPCGNASKIGFIKNAAKSPVKMQSSNLLNLQHAHYGERRRIFATRDEVTWYNLHHYEENGSYLSMGYYSRRNFNTALEGLVYCIAEACLVVEQGDMALCVPYCIDVGGMQVGRDKVRCDSSAAVAGLPVLYDPEDGERWTLVWRYLLTNLKWLIAYVAKHVDR